MKEKHLDLARMVMDHQLLDANNVECGKVNDIEIEGGPGELKITALLTGPGLAIQFLPGFVQAAAEKIFGCRVARVPWEEVLIITGQIKLKSRAAELGLADMEQKIAERLKRFPGAQ